MQKGTLKEAKKGKTKKRVGDVKQGVIGWREWVGLPDLGVEQIKAKVDTGARSSSLHAFDIETFIHDEETWVRFSVHPRQRSHEAVVRTQAKVLDFRKVRSSSGRASTRPVIITHVALLGQIWPVELTLANRDQMGFRMLLGRQAFRGKFLVDAGRSYYGGEPAGKRRAPRKANPSSAVPTPKKVAAKRP